MSSMCEINGCDRPQYGRGMCNKHWQRWRRYGNVTVNKCPERSMSTEDRFWSKVDVGDCWTWTRGLGHTGYGQFHYGDRDVCAHVWAYENLVGPVPEGLELDHLCRNRACVNPDHLEPVTPKENVLRGHGPTAINARKTHCTSGHEFTAANTYPRPGGGRACRRCRTARTIQWRQRKRLAGVDL